MTPAGTQPRHDGMRDFGGSGRDLLAPVILAVAAAAWLLLLLSDQTVAASGHSEHVHGAVPSPEAGPGTAARLTGWSLMVVAMMLPPALPLLWMLRRLVVRHRTRRLLLLSGAGSFLAVWLLFGILLVTADALLTALAGGSWRPEPRELVGAVLVLAGGFQLSSLKNRCLTACRSPRSFAVAHWHGERRPAVEAATVGAAYGVYCVGCCWALMLVCFVGGTAHLVTMVPLAVVMSVERMTHGGMRLVRPVGVAALVLGASLLLPDSPLTAPV